MKKNFRSLELIAKKYLNTYSSGIHATLQKDSLVDVDVVREYQPGDKRLDSKSSLKTSRVMSRVFNPDRNLNIFIILDISASHFNKIDYSVITALYLAYLADICSEKVGICVFSDHIVSISEPSEDYSSILGTIEKSFIKINTHTNANDALNKVCGLSLSNSFIVLISDFCYNLDKKNIRRLISPTNQFLNVVIYNPDDWVNEAPFNLTFKDAETGSVVCYKPNSTKFNDWQRKLDLLGDKVFLNVKEDNFLLPLVSYLLKE